MIDFRTRREKGGERSSQCLLNTRVTPRPSPPYLTLGASFQLHLLLNLVVLNCLTRKETASLNPVRWWEHG